jgi:hypothetical protein
LEQKAHFGRMMIYILVPLLLSSAAVSAQTAQKPNPPPAGAEAVVNPDRGDNEDRLERAATRPLRDLNIIKPRLAAELEAIMADPYDMAGLKSCRGLNNEVNRMTGLVGPDVDDPSLNDRKGRDPVEFVLDSADGIASSLVPGQGIIRELTGANKAARHVAAARLAGQLRRSYIKGMMKVRGCRLTLVPPAKAEADARR